MWDDRRTMIPVGKFLVICVSLVGLVEGLSPVRYSPRTGLAYRRKPPPGPPSPLLQSRRLEAIDSWINNIKSRDGWVHLSSGSDVNLLSWLDFYKFDCRVFHLFIDLRSVDF